MERLEGEFSTDLVEIISRKRVINDEIPGKCIKVSVSHSYDHMILVLYNFFILANSKLHILKSMNFFIRNLDTTGFRINYMVTSFNIKLSSSILIAVLQGPVKLYFHQKYFELYVTTFVKIQIR